MHLAIFQTIQKLRRGCPMSINYSELPQIQSALHSVYMACAIVHGLLETSSTRTLMPKDRVSARALREAYSTRLEDPVDDSEVSESVIPLANKGKQYPIRKNTSSAVIDDILEGNHKQSQSLKAARDRESFSREPSRSTDKKPVFWAAYKMLADEFDREFQHRYGSDLDSSLIFAGLFSAVSSAFIIQIQPQLQPDPQTTLLVFLVQNIAGTAEAPGLGTSPTTSPASTKIVVAQSLLYLSLFSTLAGAFLAVLAKRWLQYYSAVSRMGTIEERGLERQRKFDSMRRWSFDLIMQLCPVLIQSSLFIFATALSIYLWTIHRGIAAMVLSLTLLGFVMSCAMTISVLLSPDSPFQSSYTTLALVIVSSIRSLASQCRPSALFQCRNHSSAAPFSTGKCSHSSAETLVSDLEKADCSPVPVNGGPLTFARLSNTFSFTFMKLRRPLLPRFILDKSAPSHTPASTTSTSTPMFEYLPPPSKEISAILWALETSTEPEVVEAAAVLIPDVQWPLGLNLEQVQPSMCRLSDLLGSCFTSEDAPVIREGMDDRASKIIEALGVLQMVSSRRLTPWPLALDLDSVRVHDTQLASLVAFFEVSGLNQASGSRALASLVITQHHLRVIPAQRPPESTLAPLLEHFKPDEAALHDKSLLADFLFCLNSYFSPPDARDVLLRDKSQHCVLLLTALFVNLAKHGKQTYSADIKVLDLLVRKLALFSNLLQQLQVHREVSLVTAIYDFCSTPHIMSPTIALALQLIRMTDRVENLTPFNIPRADCNHWVFAMLDDLDFANFQHCGLGKHESAKHGTGPRIRRGISTRYLRNDPLKHAPRSRIWCGDITFGADLLQVLFHCPPTQQTPSIPALRNVLWALTQTPDVQDAQFHLRRRMKLFAFRVMCSAQHWFMNERLQPIMQASGIWQILADFILMDTLHICSASARRTECVFAYVTLGSNICRHPAWQNVISQRLTTWLAMLPEVVSMRGGEMIQSKFRSVLVQVWAAPLAREIQSIPERAQLETFRMASSVLAKAWLCIDYSDSDPQSVIQIIPLTHCTLSTILSARMALDETVSQDISRYFKDLVFFNLGNAIAHAVRKASKGPITYKTTLHEMRNCAASANDLLSALSSIILSELRNGPSEAQMLQFKQSTLFGQSCEAKYWDADYWEVRYWMNVQQEFGFRFHLLHRKCLQLVAERK